MVLHDDKIKTSRWENFFLHGWHPYFWILFLGALVYFQVLFFDFIPLDDRLLIVDNHDFLSNFKNLFQAFKQDFFKVAEQSSSKIYYRPMVTISLMLDAWIGGVSPFIYHLSNLVFHLLASCLLFIFLKKMEAAKNLALFFSVFFVVHPALTQAVAWILGRNDILLTVFVLSAFISLFNLQKGKIRYYFLHFLFFTLSLFTKESAIGLIFLLIFFIYFVKKEKKLDCNKAVLIAGWSVITILWYLLRHLATGSQKMSIIDVLKDTILNLPVVIKYLGKLIFPFNLSGFPTAEDTSYIWGIAALMLFILVFILTKQKRYYFILFGILWFGLFLVPSFAAIPIFPAIFEHRLYLPIIGIIIFLLETGLIKSLHRKKLLLKIGVPIFLIFSFITFKHSATFKHDFNFWQNVTRTSPHLAFAHSYLGEKYLATGLIEEAVLEYKKAIDLNPKEQGAHNALGVIYANKRMYKEAEKQFNDELFNYPDSVDALVNLARLKYMQKEFKRAEELLKKTIRINPNYVKGYEALAIFYFNQNRLQEAYYYIEQLKKRGAKIPPGLLKAMGLER